MKTRFRSMLLMLTILLALSATAFAHDLILLPAPQRLTRGDGTMRSKPFIHDKEKDVPRLYLDFLLKIHERVQKNGRQMQFWADIILQRWRPG